MSAVGDEDIVVMKFPRAESVAGEVAPAVRSASAYRAFEVGAADFGRHVAMLEVRLRSGNRLLFAYHTFTRAEWNPSRGMTLFFGDTAVVLTGRNLDGLFAALREQTAAWVLEADRAAAELSLPGAAVVESIKTELLRVPVR